MTYIRQAEMAQEIAELMAENARLKRELQAAKDAPDMEEARRETVRRTFEANHWREITRRMRKNYQWASAEAWEKGSPEIVGLGWWPLGVGDPKPEIAMIVPVPSRNPYAKAPEPAPALFWLGREAEAAPATMEASR